GHVPQRGVPTPRVVEDLDVLHDRRPRLRPRGFLLQGGEKALVSGKGAASPPPPPLRTVREGFPSYGSNKSLAHNHSPFSPITRSGLALSAECRVSLLVAVKVYQLPIRACIRSAQAPWLLVMALDLLPIEEAHATDRAAPVLPLG